VQRRRSFVVFATQDDTGIRTSRSGRADEAQPDRQDCLSSTHYDFGDIFFKYSASIPAMRIEISFSTGTRL
jgi:hypothetical protein